MKKIPALRVKNIEYVQQIKRLPKRASTTQDLISLIEEKLEPNKYALIVHDKDTDEKNEIIEPHIHLALQFENARSLNNIAKIIGDNTNRFEKATSWNNLCSYLCHKTKNSTDKYQYDPNDVISNFNYTELLNDITKKVESINKIKDSELIGKILNQLLDEDITREEALSQLNGEQLAKAKKPINDVYLRVLENKANRWRALKQESGESIRIYWIYGASGNGKTSLAKRYASSLTKDFFISGSSKDPFQTYNGESIIILDELRPNVFPYDDLLKMLDNYNYRAMIPSRYNDKLLKADAIFITSPFCPYQFFEGYHHYKKDKEDNFEQLRRRITSTIYLSPSYIELQEFDANKICYISVNNTRKENAILKCFTKLDEMNSLKDFEKLNRIISTTKEDLPSSPTTE